MLALWSAREDSGLDSDPGNEDGGSQAPLTTPSRLRRTERLSGRC